MSAEQSTSGVGLGWLLLCFVLSGFSGLLYQTVWFRQFSTVFGTSELALGTVLAAYMGGLALGAALAARWLHRVHRPVRAYAALELCVAMGALGVPLALTIVSWLQQSVFGRQADPVSSGEGILSAFHVVGAFVVLGIPTVCMGATMPLLMRHVVRSDADVSSRVGWLYAANTAGAVGGTLVAAYVLVPRLGLWQTSLIGVVANTLVGIGAWVLSRKVVVSPHLVPLTSPPPWRLPLVGVVVLMAVSGATSFTYEILWTRMLGHSLGNSLHAYATMLSCFLVGITLGSMTAGLVARTVSRARLGFVVSQLGIAGAAILASRLLGELPSGKGALALGPQVSHTMNTLAAAMIMFPAAFGIGATLPLAVRAVTAGEAESAGILGRIYAGNTLGAIVGAIAAPFWVIPTLNYAGTMRVAVTANLAVAVGAVLFLGRNWLVRLGVVLIAVWIGTGFRPVMPETVLMASPFKDLNGHGALAHWAVGRSATVTIVDLGEGRWQLRTNGLPESTVASPSALPGQGRSTWWLTRLALASRPRASSMLVVGLGGGQILESIPSSVRHIDVVELEPEVVKANVWLAPRRRLDPLTDSRVRIFEADARSSLSLTRRRYDLIVSQPSHPWTSGASHLYTQEFLSLVREHLEEDGIFVQWMHREFVDEALFRVLCATVQQVFGHVRVLLVGKGVFVVLASDNAIGSSGDLDLAPLRAVGVDCLEEYLALLLLDEKGVWEFCSGAPLNTDDRNMLANRSIELLRRPPSSAWYPGGRVLTGDATTDRSSILWDGAVPVDRACVAHMIGATKGVERAAAFADRIPDRQERRVGLALVDLLRDRLSGRQRVLDLLDEDTVDPRIGYAAVRPALSLLATGAEPPALDKALENMDDPAAAVVEGHGLAAARKWDQLARLDSRLTMSRAPELWHTDAQMLRIQWRIALAQNGKDPALAREAIRMLDRQLLKRTSAHSLRLRIACGRVVGDGQLQVASLVGLVRVLLQIRPPLDIQELRTLRFYSEVAGRTLNRLRKEQIISTRDGARIEGMIEPLLSRLRRRG